MVIIPRCIELFCTMERKWLWKFRGLVSRNFLTSTWVSYPDNCFIFKLLISYLTSWTWYKLSVYKIIVNYSHIIQLYGLCRLLIISSTPFFYLYFHDWKNMKNVSAATCASFCVICCRIVDHLTYYSVIFVRMNLKSRLLHAALNS